MNFREQYIDLEISRVAGVARDRFAVGVTGVLALGFLEGGLLGQATEGHARGQARADAQAAEASGSARLRKLAAKGMEADLAAAGSLKHRMNDFLVLRLVAPGRYAVAQLVPSLLGSVSYADTRSQAPTSMLRLRWLGALRCAVGFVTSLSTMYPLLDAYAVGARRYANDRAAARIPPPQIARIGTDDPVDATAMLKSALSKLSQLPQWSEVIIGGGLNGPRVASTQQTLNHSSSAPSSSREQDSLVLRLCGERSLQGHLAHQAAVAANVAVLKATSLREGYMPERASIHGNATSNSSRGQLMCSGGATVLPIVLAPRPPVPLLPTNLLHAALYEPTDASAALNMPPWFDPSTWPSAMINVFQRLFGEVNSKNNPVDARTAYNTAYLSSLQRASADPPFWRLEHGATEDLGAVAERAGTAAAALGLNARPRALALPALYNNSPSSSGEVSMTALRQNDNDEKGPVTTSVQSAVGAMSKLLSEASWGSFAQKPRVLVLEADATTAGEILSSNKANGSNHKQFGCDLSVEIALSVFHGATAHIAAAASAALPWYASVSTLWSSPTDRSKSTGSTPRGSIPPEEGWTMANGVRIHVRRVLLVDDKEALANTSSRESTETLRSGDEIMSGKEALNAASSTDNEEGQGEKEEDDCGDIVVVPSNDIVLSAILRWVNSASLNSRGENQGDGQQSRDLFETIGYWVLWPFVGSKANTLSPQLPDTKLLVVDTDSQDFFARVSSVLALHGWQVYTPEQWASSSPPPASSTESKSITSPRVQQGRMPFENGEIPSNQLPPLLVHYMAGDETTAKVCASALAARREGWPTLPRGSICTLTLHQPTLLPFELSAKSESIHNDREAVDATTSAKTEGPSVLPTNGETPNTEDDFSGCFTSSGSACRELSVLCVTEVQNSTLAHVRKLLISGHPPRAVQAKLDTAIGLSRSTPI